MKRLTAMAMILPLIAAPALAGDEPLVDEQESAEIQGDWVIGARVVSPAGERIGTIEDLILDMEDGTVSAAVVSVGGILGFGAKNIAVDWTELDINYDGNEILLDITREEADEAEEYIFRDQEQPPAPDPDAGMGNDTLGGNGGTQY